MHKPRLALCSFSHGPANGIARMDNLLGKGLVQLGFAVQRFVIDATQQEAERTLDGVRHLSPEAAGTILREAFSEVDIVQFNGTLDPCVTQAACESGVPHIIEALHTMDQGGMHPEINQAIAVSSLVAKQQPHARCEIIHNGIELEHFTYKEGMHSGDPVFLQVANANKELAISLDELLPNLLHSHPSIRGLLVGGRASHPFSYLENVGVLENIESLYHRADYVFMPSAYDAFGLALIEGMACGTLPLGMAHTGAADIIHHEKTGWLLRPEPQAIVEGVRLAADCLGTPKHLAMQRAARRVVEQKFSAKHCIERYAALYSHLPRQQRHIRNAAFATWQPLVQLALLAPISLERAKQCFALFVARGDIPPRLPQHPAWNNILDIACLMGQLLLREGQRDMVRAFCLLMHLGGVESMELLGLRNKTC